MKGFSLSGYKDIEIHEKVYGIHQVKVDKVMNSFEKFQRSLGVILSGDKGIGKSLFAKMLCQQAVEKGYPVVVCNNFVPGIAQFIDSIDQQIVVLFDEFDKTFKKRDDGDDAQAGMLSLFDGVSMNKKLFCVTCNSLYGLNDFLVNRPGRFHYHFRFEYPNKEQIETYMKDHLPEEKWGEIQKITQFANKVELNYDCLRAISFELLTSDTFEDAISDLNIIRPDSGVSTAMYLMFNNGDRMRIDRSLDIFSDEEDYWWFGDESEANYDYITANFIPADAHWSEEYNGFFIPASKMKVEDVVDGWDKDSRILKNHGDYIMAHRAKDVVGIVLRRNFSRGNIHYFGAV